jgi:tetratricopeptide (TPR) repeat protein
MCDRPPHRSGLRAGCLLVFALLGGCDTAKFTAESTSGLFTRAAPAFEEYWDYELAGEAVPATIVQLEGILRVVPDNEPLIEQLTRAYVGYGYGWIEPAVEALEFEGDYDTANEQRRRAAIMYLRARDLGAHQIRLHSKGLDEALDGTAEDFEQWLDKEFKKQDDAAMLLWTGYAWGLYVNASKDDMEAVADLPLARALVERSVELDPGYYAATGLTFLGVVEASSLSPDLEKSKAYFEQALAETDRRALMVQVHMARHYAVKTGDRALYEKLLNEVLAAGDVLPTARLVNRMARARAELYLDHADVFFD